MKIIDLSSKTINESWLTALGGWIEWFVKGLDMGGNNMVQIKGNQAEIDSFLQALKKEKKYFELAKRYGLTNPKMFKTKTELQSAIKKFESLTGIKWPIG